GAGRRTTEAAQEVLKLGADRGHVAERDGGCDQSDELAIVAVRIAMDERHRVGVSPGREVAARAHVVERTLDPCLARGEARAQGSLHVVTSAFAPADALGARRSDARRWARA